MITETTTIIAFANQKGGCGKTTLANEFASGLSKKGYKVLAIDMDPQGNLSESAHANTYDDKIKTVYELIKGEAKAAECIQNTKNYDIIPANILLASAEQELTSKIGREYLLKKALKNVQNNYDYIVIDTPPALSVLTVNAFTAADKIIIPVQPDLYAVSGINKLNDIILSVKENCNPGLIIDGVVCTMFEMRTNNSQVMQEVVDQLADEIKIPVYNTIIRQAVAVKEARTMFKTLDEYQEDAPKKTAGVLNDYKALIDEFLQKEERSEWI